MRDNRRIIAIVLSVLLAVVLVALGLLATINLTVLNPNFVIAEIDKANVYSAVTDKVKEKLSVDDPYVSLIVDGVMVKARPWIKRAVDSAIYDVYDYLREGKELDIVLPVKPVKDYVEGNVEQAILELLPPELEGASRSDVAHVLSDVYAVVETKIPQQIKDVRATIGPEVVSLLEKGQQIINCIHGMQRAMRIIQVSCKVLIGLAIVLAVLIAWLLRWRIRSLTSYIGIPFAVVGVVSLIGATVAQHLILGLLPIEIPPDIMSILSPLLSDVFKPLKTYGIVFLVVGVALIVFYVKFKNSQLTFLELGRHRHS